MEDRGLEPVPSSPQKTPLSQQGNAQYNALFGDDERLRLLLVAWPDLPESVKDAVSALVLRSRGEAEWRWWGVSLLPAQCSHCQSGVEGQPSLVQSRA